MKTPYNEIVDISKIGDLNQFNKLPDIIKKANKESSDIKENNILLIIDMQNDFMENGTLPVNGSFKDVENLTKFIYNNMNKLAKIALTFDEHSIYQIFNSSFWKDENGNHPNSFSIIKSEEVKNKKWIPENNYEFALQAIKALENNGRNLMIWEYHCLNSTIGQALETQLTNMLYFYENAKKSKLEIYRKGQNEISEMFSAIKPVYNPNNFINKTLIESLRKYDKIFIAGEAMSHCVLDTLKDILEANEGDINFCKKIYILKDCMSSISGFEEYTKNEFQKLIEKYKINLFTEKTF